VINFGVRKEVSSDICRGMEKRRYEMRRQRSACADIICDVVSREHSQEMNTQVATDLNRKQLELCDHEQHCSLGTHGREVVRNRGCSQHRGNVGRGAGVLYFKHYTLHVPLLA
jgi:hypothetical protein